MYLSRLKYLEDFLLKRNLTSDLKALAKLSASFDLTEVMNIFSSKKERNGLNKEGYDPEKYEALKNSKKVFLSIYSITNDKFIFNSKNSSENIEAASVSKVCAAMAALEYNGGDISNSNMKKMSKLLIESDNSVWEDIEDLAGGKQAVNDWADKNGYSIKPASSGNVSGKTNAKDMCMFWRDVFFGKYNGWEKIIDLTSRCKTHDERSLKYMPTEAIIGGKTGTFKSANHDSCWIIYKGKVYSISVFTLLGYDTDDAVATLFRGLFDEFAK